MSEVVGVVSWLLVIAGWCWIVTTVVRPGLPASAAAPPHDGAGASSRVAPPGPSADRPGALSPPGPRRWVVLLGDDDEGHARARAAARRHLDWVGPVRSQPAPADPAQGHLRPALGEARAAVLGSRSASGLDAALHDCAAAGVPLLLPARR